MLAYRAAGVRARARRASSKELCRRPQSILSEGYGRIEATMSRTGKNFILAFLSLLLMGQSLQPVAVMAEISARCIVASSSRTLCSQTTVVAAGPTAASQHYDGLACCKGMAHCSMLMASQMGRLAKSSPVAQSLALSAPKCLVSINLFDVKPSALCPQLTRWFLRSAPALAPPVTCSDRIASRLLTSVRISSKTFDLFPSATIYSHGLRAPPCF